MNVGQIYITTGVNSVHLVVDKTAREHGAWLTAREARVLSSELILAAERAEATAAAATSVHKPAPAPVSALVTDEEWDPFA